MKYRNYLIVDTETTGLDPESGAEIVQLVAKAINGNDLSDHHSKTLSLLIQPQFPEKAEKRAVEIIGQDLFDNACKNGLHPKVALAKFFEFANSLNFKGKFYKPVFVAHNARFDFKMIYHWAKHYKLAKEESDVPVDHRLFDTVVLFMSLFENDPKVNTFNLDSWLNRLGMTRASKKHDALEDVMLLSSMFVRSMKFLRLCHSNMRIGVNNNEIQKR